MILPLAGHVGETFYSVNGASTKKGFQLVIRDSHIPNAAATFQTEHYNDEGCLPKENRAISIFLGILAVIMTLVASLLNFVIYYNPDGGFIWKLFFYPAYLLIMPMFFCAVFSDCLRWIYGNLIIFSDKDWREWHALEHKCAILLEAGLEPTVENIKGMPSTIILCSVSLYGINTEIFMGIPILILITPFAFGPLLPILTALVIMAVISFSCAVHATSSKIKNSAQYGIMIMGIPMMAIPLLAEKILTLKEPSDEKINQIAAELKNYLDNEFMFWIR